MFYGIVKSEDTNMADFEISTLQCEDDLYSTRSNSETAASFKESTARAVNKYGSDIYRFDLVELGPNDTFRKEMLLEVDARAPTFTVVARIAHIDIDYNEKIQSAYKIAFNYGEVFGAIYTPQTVDELLALKGDTSDERAGVTFIYANDEKHGINHPKLNDRRTQEIKELSDALWEKGRFVVLQYI